MNFVIDLAHRRVFCGSVVRASERGMRRSEVRFLMGLRIFSLFHARDKKKRHLSLFLYRAQNLPSLLFHIEIRMFSCRASFVNRAGMTAPVQFTRADIVGGTASIRKSDSYCEMNYFS